MKTQSCMTKIVSLVVSTALLITGVVKPSYSQQPRPRPITITFGQPNIWSLEQAHYLLARMHRQNLDLQTAALGSLDPNATNASQIDILKTLLQAGVKYDQAVALNNELLRRDKTFNVDRRQQLLNDKSNLQSESTQLARDIAALKIAKAEATSEAEKTQIQTQIDAKTEEKAAVDNQLTQTNTEAQGLTSTSGDFQKAEPTDTFNSAQLTGDLDSLINKVQLVNPSIAATLRLDNHIQMQYEIIAKLLTLLRDEVGPGERLVFLELPQSINTTQDKAADKLAQTWWRIAGYTRVNKKLVLEGEINKLLENIHAIDTNVKTDDELTCKNAENKKKLLAQLAELCNEKLAREAEVQNLSKALEQALAAKDAVDKALKDAEEKNKLAEADWERAVAGGNKAAIETARKKFAETTGELIQAKQAKQANDDARCKDLAHDLEHLKESIDQTDKVIKSTRISIQKIDDQLIKLRAEQSRLYQAFTSLSSKYERLQVQLVRDQIRGNQDQADRLLQGGGANTSDIMKATLAEYKVHLEAKLKLQEQANVTVGQTTPALPSSTPKMPCPPSNNPETGGPNCDERKFVVTTSTTEEKRHLEDLEENDDRSVRTIDIIPRQNAINVNDTKQTVAKTGIFAALSFLFGFGGKFTYERQREHAEQFLNQELFTSGFGKGEKDFGWNFYPFAGSKQLASGVRTTFAIAIIPEDTESLVLKARGCYFPRKENQPVNYDLAASWNSDDALKTRRCTDEQVFVLPVPGGSGDGADYYVTGLRYPTYLEPGERMIATITGQNLPSQIGVLIDGVPLREAVGLGQLNVESILGDDKTRDNCVADTCGRFERINADEIIISFKLPASATGTPRITLIGPGRSVDLNNLYLRINGQDDTQLSNSDEMFGPAPDSTLRTISDFKVAPTQGSTTETTGVLTGKKFKPNDQIYVNGSLAAADKPCRADLCIVKFPKQSTDFLSVTISPIDAKEKTVSKTFANPANVSIISATVVSYLEEQPQTNVLTVRLDGSGFKESLNIEIQKSDGSTPSPTRIIASPGQMFLKIVSPEPIVQINIKDPANNKIVSAVVVRPDLPTKEKK